ncbi:putative acetyltransferase [Podospora conica]|nr:putative acetyltransferase [Schizothecium conicum]
MSPADDANFCFPVRPDLLANDRLKLVPMTPTRHASAFFRASSPHPDIYAHMPTGPFATESEFINFLDEKRSDPTVLILAIIDKTRPPSPEDDEGALAGMMSFFDTSPVHLSAEIGYVVTLPAFRRTHVTTNSVGLMLRYAFAAGGMGLRRVQWKASSVNAASMRVAERMGFRREGVLRWHMVFRDGVGKGKVGHGRALPKGSREGELGRDTVVLGFCWDEWEGGGEERVVKLMGRVE